MVRVAGETRVITKSDLLHGLALIMIYTELSFSVEYGGIIMIILTIAAASLAKRCDEQ